MLNRNIIHSQKMVINVDSQQDAQKLQLELRNFCRDVLPNLFNEVFDAVAPARTLRIGKMKLDLGNIRTDHFLADIKEKIISQLYQQLREHLQDIEKRRSNLFNKDEPVSEVCQGPFSVDEQRGYFDDTNDVSRYEALLHYCRYGLKPWWISNSAGFSPVKILEDLFASRYDLFIRLTEMSGPGSRACHRLMALISKQQFFDHFGQFSKPDSELVKVFAVGLDFENYQRILEYWLSAIVEQRERKSPVNFASWILRCAQWCPAVRERSIRIMKKMISELQLDRNKTNLLRAASKLSDLLQATPKTESAVLHKEAGKNAKTVQPVKKPALNADQSLAIENAGLILVWPFLKSAFLQLNWLSENQFKDKAAIEKGIVWLHFLIHETLPVDESCLVLNKLLCGLDIEEAMTLNNIRLSRKELAEAEDLKMAVIQNWPALKTTATSALKESFFKRSGLLKIKDDSWYLTIERKGIDVLIDRLPWPIANVKLPWNNYMIHVNW